MGYNETVTLTATVAGTSGTPTGAVSFYINGSFIGTTALSGGQATRTYTNTAASSGNITISASYAGNSSFQASSGTADVAVSAVPSTTTLTSTPNPSVVGQAVVFTAKVVGRGGARVSGTVRFYDSGTPISELISVNANGSAGATVAYTAIGLSQGEHAVTAVFSTTSSLYAQSSASPVLDHTVNAGSLTPTTTSVSSSQSSMGYYETVTLTATVSGSGGTPTGSVNFYVNGNSVGSATLSGGHASRTFTNTLASSGSVTVSAVYLGDTTFQTSSGTAAVSVSAPPSTTTVSSSLNPGSVGQTVVFSANVIGRGGAYVAGTVRFYDGANAISAPISINGAGSGGVTITYSALSLSEGTHTITAVYISSGSPYAQSSTSPALTQTMNASSLATTTTSVSSSQNPMGYYETVTLTATVSGSGGTPTGSVNFYVNGNSVGSATLSGGQATQTFTNTIATNGNLTVSAIYPGDASFQASTGAATVSVSGPPSTTTVSSSLNPSTVGQAVVLTANVIGRGGSYVNGTVQFYDGATAISGAVSISGQGSGGSTVTYIATGLSEGAHTITAAFNGSFYTQSSTSPAITQTVNASSLAPTTTNVSPSQSSVGYSEAITLSATVSSSGGTPTGTVNFYANGFSIGSVPLSGGQATRSYTNSSISGSITFSAIYLGDASFQASTGTASIPISPSPSTTTLISSVNPSSASQAVVFGANVVARGGANVVGTLRFYDGGTDISGPISISGSGTAGATGTYTAFGMSLGTHTITAVYTPSASYYPQGSTSPAISQTVNTKQPQEISFTSSPPSGRTVGGPDYNVAASSTSGLAVTFSIDPAAASVCTITGSTVSFVGAGTCIVNANQAGNGTYNPAPQVQQSFAVGKGNQSIAFTSTPPGGAVVGGPSYTVTANATSGLAATFSIAPAAAGVCTISGATVSFTGFGTCVVYANQAGDGTYNPAPQVQQSFAVGKGTQSIIFTSSAPSGAVVGGPSYTVTASATSNLAVTFSIDAAAAGVCTVTGATVNFIGFGSCIVNANQAGDANYLPAAPVQQSFAVGKGSQSITFTSSAPGDAVVGGPSYTVTASATSNLAVTFSIDAASAGVCTITGATINFTGFGSCAVNANQAGDANYLPAAPVQQSFAVGKGSQSIAFTSSAPSGAVVGGPSYTVAANATSGLAVTFSIDAASTGVCTITGATVSFTATGTCAVNADQAGSTNYLSAPQVQQLISVGQGSQAIAFTSTPPADAMVGGPSYTVTATGGASGNEVTFSIDSSATGACSIAGPTVSFTGIGTCIVNANQAGNGTYSAAPQVQQSFAVGKGSQSITFTSTPPSGAVVGGPSYTVAASATSGLDVTFSIDSSAAGVCTISGATVTFIGFGTCAVNANQAGNGSYNPAPQVQQSFAVGKGSQSIAFTSSPPSDAVVGGSSHTVAASATSGLAVTFSIDAASAGVCTIAGAMVSFTGAGTCSVNANQAGDANYLPAAQVQQSFTVDKGTQTITFTDPADRTYVDGDTEILEATASPSGLTVTFASTTPSVCAVSGSTVSILSAGTCSITASQAGDNNYEAAPDVVQSFDIEKIETTASVASSQNPSLSGQSVTFTATVTPPTAIGTVTFRDGATTLGTGTLSSGLATFSTDALASGAHSIIAEYGGDTNHSGATSIPLPHNVTPNGSVILAVATTEGDGTISFSSPTPSLSLSVTTSGGSGQSAAISLNPGTYTVTAALPDGFGLTGISCSDGDSRGNAAAKTLAIALAPAESVTCTFSAVNSRKKTVEVISQFMNRRNDLLLSNGPDANRQIDRLREAGGEGSESTSNFAGDGTASGTAMAGRLGDTVGIGSPLGGVSRSSYTAANARFGVSSLGAALPGQAGEFNNDGQYGGLRSGLSPVTVTGSNEEQAQFSFAGSLSQLGQYYKNAEQRKISDLDSAMGVSGLKLASPKAAFSPFDLWVEGHYLDFSGDEQSGAEGRFGVVYVGADYVLSPWLLVGALVQYDSLEQKSHKDQYEIKGHGFMAGPYATVRLSDNVFLQGRAAWGTSDNEVSPFLTYTDTFDTERWLVSGTLSGDWAAGAWRLRPSASLSYVEDVSEAYTDSLGVRVPGLKASLGQVKVGPEVSYRIDLGEGAHIEPHTSVEMIWNFDSSDQVADFGGTLEGPEEARGRIEAGVKAQLTNGLMLDISATYDGIGSSDFEAIGGKALARVPLN